MSQEEPHSVAASLRNEQVVAAVRMLFCRYGYRRTSVDDIAREAGVSKATLYLHFKSKEEMFQAMMRQFRIVIVERCETAEAMDGDIGVRVVELLYASYGTALEWFDDAAHIRELKSVAAANPPPTPEGDMLAFRRRLEYMLTQAGETGELVFVPGGPKIADVANTLLFAAHGAKQAQRDGAGGFRDAVATIVALVLAGLRVKRR